jgi:addiction module HigA family antidote
MPKRKKIHIHPGEILNKEFLALLGISANRFVVSLGVPANRIGGTINGERAITGQTALLFGMAFNTSRSFGSNYGRITVSGSQGRKCRLSASIEIRH